MYSIEKVDTTSKGQVNRFVRLPFRLFNHHGYWVPPLLVDSVTYLNREKHPFFEHSDADFFLIRRGGTDIGRIAVMENRLYNQYHDKRQAHFYFFDCEEDYEAAAALFDCVFSWAKERGLNQVVGPKGFGPLDGYGLLVEGYDHRQMMNMMNYNYPYYVDMLERSGFSKVVDFVSCYVKTRDFRIPERVHRIAERVIQRGALSVKLFRNKKELRQWASRIGKAYNQAFVNNWEYYPLTDREISFVLDNIMLVADPKLIKIITHGQDVVGFLFAFPDVSSAMQRAHGRLFPFGIFDLLLEMRRTNWISLNGMGILEEFQGRGGNALLYSEMEKTLNGYRFEHADLTQVAESAVQMRNDLINLGGKPYKNHRVYKRDI
jgi:hypothetical protein